jgi:hypothetical protein
MSNSHQLEHDNLQAAIASIENAVATAPQGARPLLETALSNARKRLEELDKEIKHEEQRERAELDARIVSDAERETALSQSEKETYSGFLKEEFFTKKDFGRLEQFYSHTWDRLSEHGKDEMSHRVWEGVRHGEYKFSELPKDVREKESDRAYAALVKRNSTAVGLEGIPALDRNDFLRAHESGNREEEYKILDRPSFRDHMALKKPDDKKNKEVEKGTVAENSAVVEATKAVTKNSDAEVQKKEPPAESADFSAVNLSNLKAPPITSNQGRASTSVSKA